MKTNCIRCKRVNAKLTELTPHFTRHLGNNTTSYKYACPVCGGEFERTVTDSFIEKAYVFNQAGDQIIFDPKVDVGSFKATVKVNAEQVQNIICTALEGGIGYWAGVDNSKEDFKDKPKEIPLCDWVTILLLDGRIVYFFEADTGEMDAEDLQYKELTLDKLIEGVRLNHVNRPHDNDLDNMDASTADCIIQYALFNEIVYG